MAFFVSFGPAHMPHPALTPDVTHHDVLYINTDNRTNAYARARALLGDRFCTIYSDTELAADRWFTGRRIPADLFMPDPDIDPVSPTTGYLTPPDEQATMPGNTSNCVDCGHPWSDHDRRCCRALCRCTEPGPR